MKKIPLLPKYFRWIGCTFVVFSLAIFFADLLSLTSHDLRKIKIRTFVLADNMPFKDGGNVYFGFSEVNLNFSLIVLGSLLGLCGITFSRKAVEDEFVNSLRLFAWSWAIILSILYAVLANLFVFGTYYLTLMVLFPHLLLTIFIVIFNFQWWRFSKGSSNEK